MYFSGKNVTQLIFAIAIVIGVMYFIHRPAYAATCSFNQSSGIFTNTASCTFNNAVDGIDHGTGTVNSGVLRINTGSITIGANQTIAVGSINLTGGSLVIIGGGKLILNTPLWYTDADGDGAYDSVLVASKTMGANYVRKNAISPSSFDCNSGSTEVSISHAQCYTDADGDGYTVGLAANTTCLNSSSCNTATKASASTNGATVTTYTAGRLRDSASATADCGDGNANAKPGQTSYFTGTFTNTATGLSYDWNCDGTQTLQNTTIYSCATSGCASHYFTITAGWQTSAPACGASANWRTYPAGAGSSGACTINVAGAGTTCPTATTTTVTQGCR